MLHALVSTVETSGDLGVVSEVNTQTYFVGPAAAAAALAEYLPSLPPSALPSKTYTGPLHAAAPFLSTRARSGSWSVTLTVAFNPASCGELAVAVCTRPSTGAAFTCAAIEGQGGHRVSRPVQVPPGGLQAYAKVSCPASGEEVVLPPDAPQGAWPVSA